MRRRLQAVPSPATSSFPTPIQTLPQAATGPQVATSPLSATIPPSTMIPPAATSSMQTSQPQPPPPPSSSPTPTQMQTSPTTASSPLPSLHPGPDMPQPNFPNGPVPQFIPMTGRAQRTQVLQSRVGSVGIVPLQPTPIPADPETPVARSGYQAPNSEPSFDLNNAQTMETMKAFISEALRQIGVNEITLTKTRRKNTRKLSSVAIKEQQATMSSEADKVWKVSTHIKLDFSPLNGS